MLIVATTKNNSIFFSTHGFFILILELLILYFEIRN